MPARREPDASRVARVQFVNVVLAGCALLWLGVVAQGAGQRAAALGALLTVPLLLLQVFAGLVPAIRCMRAPQWTGGSRRLLLLPAIFGLAFSAGAVGIAIAADGGC